MIVRGFPVIKDIPGEKQDHSHHQSCFFTYGDVNGIDFWSEPKDSTKDGRIVGRQILKMEGGKGRGELVTTADWLRPYHFPIISQKQTVIFQSKKNVWAMDFTITLKALDKPITFYDTKEGMFGIRVTPSLQDNQEGEYINSNGQKGSQECWGQRAAWVALRGPVKDEKVVLAIFEHPQSVNHPTYWHVRDYGLFAANPFGSHIFTDKKEAPLNYTLQPGEKTVFKYRVLVYYGDLTKDQLAQEYEKYKKGEF